MDIENKEWSSWSLQKIFKIHFTREIKLEWLGYFLHPLSESLILWNLILNITFNLVFLAMGILVRLLF